MPPSSRGPASSRRRSWLYDGLGAGQHPLKAIGAALVLTVLCIPILFARSPTAWRDYPGSLAEAWVSVDAVPAAEGRQPDVEIRQAWILGNRSSALRKETLLEAAAAQQYLLRGIQNQKAARSPTLASDDAVVHSILTNLDCSEACLDTDATILDAVNRAAYQVSQANITLRPKSALSSPIVRSSAVLAADGIVISLFHRPGSKAGEVWNANAAKLAQQTSKWVVQQTNSSGSDAVVRVQHLSRTVLDAAVLYVVFGVAAAYTTWHVSKAKVLKSRTVQLAAIAIEVLVSTVLALAVTSLTEPNVWTVPRMAYPLVGLVQAVGNCLQLLHLVGKSSQGSNSSRVSSAFKRLNSSHLLATGAHAGLYVLLSALTPSSGFTTFCHFAVATLLIDNVVFTTFFGAVTALNLRKMGLEESFANKEQLESSPSLKTSTSVGRVAGPASRRASSPRASQPHSPYVMSVFIMVFSVCFVASHFFDGAWHSVGARHALLSSLPSLNPFSFYGGGVGRHTPDTLSWLHLQDAETLGEITRAVAAPHHHNAIPARVLARVAEPLILVQGGTAGILPPSSEAWWSTWPYDSEVFAYNEAWMPSIALAGLILAGLIVWGVFMSDPDGDGSQLQNPESGAEISSVRCISPAHTLDVFLLAAGARRFVVSVGFDREVHLWNLETSSPSPVAGAGAPPQSQLIPSAPAEGGVVWPISMVSIDNSATWVAIVSRGNQLALWNRQRERFGPSTTTDARIAVCFFATVPGRDRFHTLSTRVLLVLETGTLVDLNVETGEVVTSQICQGQVQSSHSVLNVNPRMGARLTTISKEGGIYISVNREGWWSTRPLQIAGLISAPPNPAQPLRFSVIPSLRGVGIAYNGGTELHLVDMFSGMPIHTITLRSIKFKTLRAFHSPPQSCVYCGSTAVASFSVAYTEKDGGAFKMTTISAEDRPQHYRTGLICFRSQRDIRERRCAGFLRGAEVTHEIPEPGVWEVTGANGVAGVRKRELEADLSKKASAAASRFIQRRPRGVVARRAAEEKWEAWTMTAKGIMSIHSLTTSLVTNKSGPVCRLARNAIAVGLADIIVLVQFGSRLHDDDDGDGLPNKPTHGRLSRQNSRVSRTRTGAL